MAKKAKADAVLEPWERQPEETSKAFEAFAIYRNLGPERSQEKVSKHLAKCRQLIGEWSRKYDWVSRAAAWDMEQDRLNRIVHQKHIREMNEQQARISKALLGKALNAFSKADLEQAKLGELARIMELALKYERIALGADTPAQQQENAGDPDIEDVQIYLPDNGRD